MESAIDVLRTKGIAKAAKKAGRTTGEGVVGSYIHAGGKVGVLRRGQLRDRLRGAHRGLPVAGEGHRHAHRRRRSQVRATRGGHGRRARARARDLPRAGAAVGQARQRGRSSIVDGKVEKFYGESVLLEQPFVKDPDKTIGELVAERVAKIGENIQVRRFARFKLGEGSRSAGDFAAEVWRRRAADDGTPPAVRSSAGSCSSSRAKP